MSRHMFLAKIADIKWKIEHTYPYVRERFSDYIISDAREPVLISSTKEGIEKVQREHPEFPIDYSEGDCIYQGIAERLPMRERMLFHGAVIRYGGEAFLFTAPSGTGKSTHISLWRDYLGEDVEIINGDKPVLAVEKEGVFVYGTPWSGKENWQTNCREMLRAVILIRRSNENDIKEINPGEYLPTLMQQVYLPTGKNAGERVLELLDELMQRIPFYLLQCDMSEGAVRCSFEKLTGLSYNQWKKERKGEKENAD